MRYYSTNLKSPQVSLREALEHGYAPDGGLYMPQSLPVIPRAIFKNIGEMSLRDIAYIVVSSLFGADIDPSVLNEFIAESLDFDVPLNKVGDNIYSLELYHGPTLSAKDIPSALMMRLLRHFRRNGSDSRRLRVLVATSGDSGSAVGRALRNMPGVQVFILYPSGRITDIQESQLTSLGDNIIPVEINGSYDDCHFLAKQAILDTSLNDFIPITSGNSINIAQLLPQIIYFFHAYGRAVAVEGVSPDNVVIALPGGNLATATAGVMARRMGLPVKRLIVADNELSVKPAKASGYGRLLSLYGDNLDNMAADIDFERYPSSEILNGIAETFFSGSHLLDPHASSSLLALRKHLHPGETGVILEMSHPVKFRNTVEQGIGYELPVPDGVDYTAAHHRRRFRLSANYAEFRQFLYSQS